MRKHFFKQEVLDEVFKDNYRISENIIKDLSIVVLGHFGNAVALQISCECCSPIPLYNSTSNIGYILQTLIELYKLDSDMGTDIRNFIGKPILLVYDSKNEYLGKLIAIGSPENNFILLDKLMTMNLRKPRKKKKP